MNATVQNAEDKAPWLQLVRQQIESLDYGVVQIVVHGHRVVQIDKTEKLRLDKSGASPISSLGENEQP